MEAQPARVNYFFGDCYGDLGRTIATTFSNLGSSITDCAEHIADIWEDEGWMTPWGILKIGFFIGVLVCSAVISTILCVVFSAVHVLITVLVMSLIYLWFSFLWLLDTIMCRFRKIVSSCPSCQRKFALPHYVCGGCGSTHTKLKPSKYGILKRECNCGNRLPTTFFNGRQRLDAICPYCGYQLNGGGFLVNISIPVVGGPSAGKTCLINMAISELERLATDELDYTYEYNNNGRSDLPSNLRNMEKGNPPLKTNDMQLVYYDFYFTPSKAKVKNQISLCDVGGEVYADSESLAGQIGYNLANAYLMVIDPLSIDAFRKELEATPGFDASKYKVSAMKIDEVLSLLINTLENMGNFSSRQRVEKSLAIVFTKCDMPLIGEKIGDSAVDEYVSFHANDKHPPTRKQARNALCEEFLVAYDQADFLNTVRARFANVQYFTSSALGHNINGDKFAPVGVADPILWLIDKQSPTINLKKYWEQHP